LPQAATFDIIIRDKTSCSETLQACFDRAWFLTLAHTRVRLSESLDLRVGEVNLAASCATIRGGKPGRDRVVYLSPVPSHALKRYVNQRPGVPDDDHLFVLHGRSPLKQAFADRLAAKDPVDESVPALLELTRTGRAKAEVKEKSRKKKRR
jgi:integrase